MEFQELVKLFLKCEYNVFCYTGHSMGNKKCLAIDTGDPRVVLDIVHELCQFQPDKDMPLTREEFLALSLEKIQSICENLRDMNIDYLGKGQIIYWPSLLWEGEKANYNYEDVDNVG